MNSDSGELKDSEKKHVAIYINVESGQDSTDDEVVMAFLVLMGKINLSRGHGVEIDSISDEEAYASLINLDDDQFFHLLLLTDGLISEFKNLIEGSSWPIPDKVRPHVEKALKQIEEALSKDEFMEIACILAAKLKYHDSGVDIDSISPVLLRQLVNHWNEGNDFIEFVQYLGQTIVYLEEVREES